MTTTAQPLAVVLTAEPLMVASAGAARLCGVATRTWQTMTSAGLTPAWVKLGSKRVWRVDVLAAWTAAGCPAREQFEARRRTGESLDEHP